METSNNTTTSNSLSSSQNNASSTTPELKKKNKVSFRTLKLTGSKRDLGITFADKVDEARTNTSDPIVEAVERSRDVNDHLILRGDKTLQGDGVTCAPRHVNEEVMYLEDIFVGGDNDEPVLEVETYEWVPLSAHFQMSDDKDMQHMHQPSKTTDACEITLQSTVLPPKYFYDAHKQSYFVLDGVHRTFYLRKAGATHVLALVSSIKDISYLDNKDFWTTNYKVNNWEDLQKRLHKFAVENEVKLK